MSTVRSSILSNSAIIFAARLAAMVSIFFAGILIARALGPSGKGLFAIITLLPLWIVRFTHLGLGSSFVYFTGREPALAANRLRTVLLYGIVVTIGGVAALVIAWPWLSVYLFANEQPDFWLILVALATAPIQIIGFYLAHVSLAFERFRVYSIIEFLTAFIQLVSLLAVTMTVGLDLPKSIIANAIGLTVPTLLAIFIWRHLVFGPVRKTAHHLKEMAVYGWKNFLVVLSDFIQYRVDLLILAFFGEIRNIGIYTVAVGLGELLWYIPTSIATALFPRVARDQSDSGEALTAKVLRMTLFLVLLMSIALLLISPWFIKFLYGKEFSEAWLPLAILVPGILVLALSRLLSSYWSGRGKPEIPARASAVAAVLNIVLNLLLIPTIGILGAAFASMLSYNATGWWMLYRFRKLTKYSWFDILVIRAEDVREARLIIQSQFFRQKKSDLK